MGADSSARGGEIKSLRESICVALCNNNSPYYQQLQPLQEKAVFLKLFFRLLWFFFPVAVPPTYAGHQHMFNASGSVFGHFPCVSFSVLFNLTTWLCCQCTPELLSKL